MPNLPWGNQTEEVDCAVKTAVNWVLLICNHVQLCILLCMFLTSYYPYIKHKLRVYLQCTIIGPLEGGASSRALSTSCTSSSRGGALSGVFWSGHEVYQYCRRLRSSPPHWYERTDTWTNRKAWNVFAMTPCTQTHKNKHAETDFWSACCSACISKMLPWC